MLMAQKLDQELKFIINFCLRLALEIGIFDYVTNTVQESNFLSPPDDPEFRVCLNNQVNLIDNNYTNIKFSNIKRFSLFMLLSYAFSFTLLIVNWIRFLKKNTNSKTSLDPINGF